MDATIPFWMRFGPQTRADTAAQTRTDPPVRQPRAPIFIHDAVTPFRGETLLGHLLRQDIEASSDIDLS